MHVTTQDYGQFLVNSVKNFTGTHFAETVKGLEHDSVWRYLNGSKLPARVIWERVKTDHPNRTDYVVTNDLEQIGTSGDATKACRIRWKIEQYHREVKQATGIGKCQARNAKAQRKPIITAIFAWIVLEAAAYAKKITIYALKNEPLRKFQAMMWRRPYTAFST